jgi:acyl carrier protein
MALQYGDNGQPTTRTTRTMHSDDIRRILAEHGRLLVDAGTLSEDADLYEAGLTSLSTVNVMLALEEHFDVEFLDRMLGRKTFGSIRSLSNAIAELRPACAPASRPAPRASSLAPGF